MPHNQHCWSASPIYRLEPPRHFLMILQLLGIINNRWTAQSTIPLLLLTRSSLVIHHWWCSLRQGWKAFTTITTRFFMLLEIVTNAWERVLAVASNTDHIKYSIQCTYVKVHQTRFMWRVILRVLCEVPKWYAIGPIQETGFQALNTKIHSLSFTHQPYVALIHSCRTYLSYQHGRSMLKPRNVYSSNRVLHV